MKEGKPNGVGEGHLNKQRSSTAMNLRILTLPALLVGLFAFAHGDDIADLEHLLQTTGHGSRPAVEAKLAKLLTDRSLSYQDRREVVELGVRHEMVTLIPVLVREIDNTGEMVGSMRPWEQQYLSVAGLLSFADSSVPEVLKGLVAENKPARRDLMLVTLLGMLGLEDTHALLAAYGEFVGTPEAAAKVRSFSQRAVELAAGAPGIRLRDRAQTLPFPIAVLQPDYKRPPVGTLIQAAVKEAGEGVVRPQKPSQNRDEDVQSQRAPELQQSEASKRLATSQHQSLADPVCFGSVVQPHCSPWSPG